ncbi:MAG TPA: DUF4097 family beta strand repeat-containing protein [Mycobacteriales bacterium]
MPDYSFDTPEPVDLRIKASSGTVTVVAADTATSTVEVTAIDDDAREVAEETTVRLSGRALVVETPERRQILSIKRRRIAITVTVPTGSSLTTRTASAAVSATGRYGTVSVHTASGRIDLDQVDGDVEAHVASGDVSINSGRAVSAHSASGRIRIGHASGDIDIKAASGKIQVGVAEGSVRAKTASGDISIDEARAGTIALDVASGDLRIGVRSGVTAHLDLRSVSGRIRSELPVDEDAPDGGAPLEIRARSTSGNVLVVPAARV